MIQSTHVLGILVEAEIEPQQPRQQQHNVAANIDRSLPFRRKLFINKVDPDMCALPEAITGAEHIGRPGQHVAKLVSPVRGCSEYMAGDHLVGHRHDKRHHDPGADIADDARDRLDDPYNGFQDGCISNSGKLDLASGGKRVGATEIAPTPYPCYSININDIGTNS